MAQFPSTTSASDIWSLVDAQRAQSGANWPSPARVPGAPTGVTATAGNAQASVAFTAPADPGTSAITSYTVTSSPGGFSASGSASPIVVTGLTNGTAYTFTVTATNGVGTGPASTASNSVTPSAAVKTTTVEYLVVAGGGGGGDVSGGGGGAGGFRTASNFAVTAGSPITVTVGAGGSGGVYNAGGMTNGSNSVFGSITSIGGGFGAGRYPYPNGPLASSGGSGGGGMRDHQAGASGTSGQGNAGGSGSSAGGGGGGAASAGANNSGAVGGDGGNGTASSISGSSTFYAGGGGGGGNNNTPGAGGNGGGGAGGINGAAGTAGTANTGGGGGGGANDRSGANGGSGVVIIRYPDTFVAAVATTGSPTVTVTGGFRIYRWTGSGSITF